MYYTKVNIISAFNSLICEHISFHNFFNNRTSLSVTVQELNQSLPVLSVLYSHWCICYVIEMAVRGKH
jgi:hypothetical protein